MQKPKTKSLEVIKPNLNTYPGNVFFNHFANNNNDNNEIK